MEQAQSDERAARIAAAATAERELIESELEAERTLARAEARLASVMKDFKRIEREVAERQKRVNEARAVLTAVQERRAAGPGVSSK